MQRAWHIKSVRGKNRRKVTLFFFSIQNEIGQEYKKATLCSVVLPNFFFHRYVHLPRKSPWPALITSQAKVHQHLMHWKRL